MRFAIKVILITVVMGLAAGGAYAIHETIPSETRAVLPGPDAKALNAYIIKLNPYQSWSLWPGKGKLYAGREPHGSLLTAYVNDEALYAINKKKGMGDGAIIVKENYTKEKKFVALTVMYKIKGYNPEAGDWFWAKYAPDGTVEAAGKIKGCINCHGTKKENDFIFSGAVK